jgi:hypothetical protein
MARVPCILCGKRAVSSFSEYGKLTCRFHPQPVSTSQSHFGVRRGHYPCCDVEAWGPEETAKERRGVPLGCTPIDHVFTVEERDDLFRHGTGVVRLKDAPACTALCGTVTEHTVEWNALRTDFLDDRGVPYAYAFTKPECLRGDAPDVVWTDEKGDRIASLSVVAAYGRIPQPVGAAKKSIKMEKTSTLYDLTLFDLRSGTAVKAGEGPSKDSSFIPFAVVRRVGPEIAKKY